MSEQQSNQEEEFYYSSLLHIYLEAYQIPINSRSLKFHTRNLQSRDNVYSE